ncbi:MAG: aminotransferase class I/II-fold pyridoxal phosphate-dependent enzyme [bacterium]|nr:aminotransferase class I/II-fold pyridoxal phosphate-dependent enzyme [bacterium]
MNKSKRLYLSPPQMSEEGYELQYIQEAFASNWIAPLGPQVDAFEKEFGEYIGVPYTLALSSGTAALHLALLVLGVETGDEVVCSSFTFAASANAITYVGAKPIFVDSDEETWNLSPYWLEVLLKEKAKKNQLPKAIVAVDILGQSCHYNPILKLCEEYQIPLIEDAAEALGAEYYGKKCGQFGVISAFSFNGNKIITTSGGGMLASNNKEYIDKARFLSTQARDPAPHYQHSTIGYNYRLSNILAAIGRGQLKVLPKRILRRREIFRTYQKGFENVPGITWMPEPKEFYSTNWLTCALIDPKVFGATREDIRLKLEEHNIESRPLWKPMHLQPVFQNCEYYGENVSEKLFELGICLPSGGAMTKEQQDFIIQEVISLSKNKL